MICLLKFKKSVVFLFFFCSFFANGTPALLTGVISNAFTGFPIVGAKIMVNGQFAYSTSGGVYALSVFPGGTFPVSCTKAGFEPFNSSPVLLQPGVTTLVNIILAEITGSPELPLAMLDSGNQLVSVSWQAPNIGYELLYDDGIQENFTVWAFQGNMNAVRFSPAGYPANITGGSINIGSPVNYPAGSNPLVPFQIQIFDASGTGGTPGNALGTPFTVVPTTFGWIDFVFPNSITVNSGSFYLTMIQQGNAPNAAGISIDETAPQFRSYSCFVTGGSPWFPAGGNFMMRAKVNGPGGPQMSMDQLLSANSYHVYRLRQGEEQNFAAWSFIGSTVQPGIIDTSWNTLPCGPYRWGIKAGYPGNRWSSIAFTNVLGKCWTVPFTCQLLPSCATSTNAGTGVDLVNLAYPDTAYRSFTDISGVVAFPAVWKGTYKLTATRFGYDTIVQTIPITHAISLGMNLMQVKMPPKNLTVDDTSLMARWDVPTFEYQLFNEDWNTGSFASNGWTTEPPASNWTVSAANGNPAPSAVFNSIPLLTGYSHALVSKTLQGVRSTLLKLKYDVFLESYGTTSVNQLAVEIWNGNSWATLKNYSNSDGNIPWTQDDIDISSVSNQDFKIRFRAFGGDSQDINRWNIDNISIVASEPAQEQANCILGYYFYLGNAIIGYTTKNAFPIPPEQVQYGQTYTACVRSLYGSGYSDFACTTLTSWYLYPVRNIQGNPVENTAFVTWEKPVMANDSAQMTPPGLLGYFIYRNDSMIQQINDTDLMVFYDYNLEPGPYQYGVSAIYDLTAYGYPGQISESIPAGPLHITIAWGRTLPFFEPWDNGSFVFNEWRWSPDPGNWIMDMAEGSPAPAASFRWQPPKVNYDFSLESPAFNGLSYTCAEIWLDFDLKLEDRNATGDEKLNVEIYYNGVWHKKCEIKNLGSSGPSNYHVDISEVRGKGFRVRFRASGMNSADIVHWLVDNIKIYPECYPAVDVSGEQLANVVKLTWSPPLCHSGIFLLEGFENVVFPPNQWTENATNPDASWTHLTLSSPIGVHSGNYSAGLNWDYNHQDEWLIAENVYVSGDLSFWSYAIQGSLHQDHYFVKISTDNGASWNILLDLSALPPYPGTNGINDWMSPYIIDLSDYIGQTVDIAWHAIDGDGNGLWYPWAIDDCSVGYGDLLVNELIGKSYGNIRPKKSREITGYDIFRKGDGGNEFALLNLFPVSDTTYLDTLQQSGQYRYFIRTRFSECENPSNSDTILIDVITSESNLEKSLIRIFPNPADQILNIQSSKRIEMFELFGIDGTLRAKWEAGEPPLYSLNLRHVPSGLYMLRVGLAQQTYTFKLCVSHE